MQPVWSLSRYLNSWSMRSGVPSLKSSEYTYIDAPAHTLNITMPQVTSVPS